jgi:hypothetical protein
VDKERKRYSAYQNDASARSEFPLAAAQPCETEPEEQEKNGASRGCGGDRISRSVVHRPPVRLGSRYNSVVLRGRALARTLIRVASRWRRADRAQSATARRAV